MFTYKVDDYELINYKENNTFDKEKIKIILENKFNNK